jgi:hypothetical protein
VLIVVPLAPLVLQGAVAAGRALSSARVRAGSLAADEREQKESRDSELAMVVSPLA